MSRPRPCTARQAPSAQPHHAPTAILLLGFLAALVIFLDPAWAAGVAGARARSARAPHIHFACSSKGAAKRPCRFSTPSNDIHCQWLPSTGAITCELLSSGHGYLLAPTGKARGVRPHLPRRGEALPTEQQLVFPRGLSCHDTKTTVTCSQDFADGSFTLAPRRHGGSSSPVSGR